jgi:hypothetical protein
MRGATSMATAALLGAALSSDAGPPADPLTTEVERWSAILRDDRASDDFAKQVKEGANTGLVRIEQALKDDRRSLALLRMSSVANDVAALRYLKERSPEQRKDVAAFEAEWTRLGGVLASGPGPHTPSVFDEVRPAVLRAIGEASLPQAGVLYHASVEYGRSTTPDSGLYYLGAAQGQRDFATFVRSLTGPTTLTSPAVRDVAGELEDLQDDLLAAYRPPASIDRHREFIVANSTLKEARELQALGLRHGALLRYLQAAVRIAPLRAGASAPDGSLPGKLKALQARLGGADHSIGQLLLEWAQADLAEHATDGQAQIAAAIASDALPRYFAALEPERPRPARPAPTVAVTLVRWPYT